MSEGIRDNIPLSFALETVIADGGGGGDRLLDVAGFEDSGGAISMVGPNTRKKIGLEFEAHRKLIIIRLA